MNIPDFAFQLQEIERQLRAQADLTAAVWQDGVKDRFYKQHVDHFCHIIEMVINGDHHGDYGIYQRSLNEMLEGISICFDKMASASETSPSALFDMAMNGMHDGTIRDSYNHTFDVEGNYKVQSRGQVYDENLERDYWDRGFSGPRPGTLENDDMDELMKRRTHGW